MYKVIDNTDLGISILINPENQEIRRSQDSAWLRRVARQFNLLESGPLFPSIVKFEASVYVRSDGSWGAISTTL